MTPLSGKLAVVTGASRGIGRVTAERLEAAGARHVVRMARSLNATTRERHSDLPCDVTNEDEVARAAERVLATHGVPDILVNNAGAFLLRSLTETTTADFRTQLEANLVGAFFVLRSFLPHLVRRGEGHVVNVGSVADHEAFPGNAAYGASKYGLRGLHEAARVEHEGSGVRFTLVSPGPTDTAIWDALDPDRRTDLTPRARMLHPEDVAETIVFAVTRPPRVSIDWIWINPAT